MGRHQVTAEPADAAVSEEDLLRARFYALLARLLSAAPDGDTLAMIASLEGDDATDMGRAVAALAAVAGHTPAAQAEDEYDALFIGVVRGELMPFASYYLTGFLHEKPLAELRADLERLGITRAEGVGEPEDHLGFLFEVMHGLITGSLGEAVDLDRQRAFFEAHIRPWAPRLMDDLEAAEAAVLYMPVATIGRLFLEIENEAFAMAA